METNDTPVPNGDAPQTAPQPDAAASASTTQESPAETSGNPGPAAPADVPFRAEAAAPAATAEQPAAAAGVAPVPETVVDLGGVKAEAMAGALNVQRQDDVGFVSLTPAPTGDPARVDANDLNTDPAARSLTLVGAGAATVVGSTAGEGGVVVTGDMEYVRARMHAIEAHALRWGGEIGTAIRNEVGALMDHLGVPRPH